VLHLLLVGLLKLAAGLGNRVEERLAQRWLMEAGHPIESVAASSCVRCQEIFAAAILDRWQTGE
jgi:hypothetical protein